MLKFTLKLFGDGRKKHEFHYQVQGLVGHLRADTYMKDSRTVLFTMKC